MINEAAGDHRGALAGAMPGLLRYAQSLVADPVLAEDLVQITLVRGLEKISSFRADASMATWLHRILHNVAVDHARRSREVPIENLEEVLEERWRDASYTVDADVVVAAAETVEELKDALVRLPIIYRAAVVLHDQEGLTVPEIARIQRVSLAAAKQRLRRGRMMLVTSLANGAERREAKQGVPLPCWDARIMISDYLDDELPERDRLLVEKHLERCPTCPPLVAAVVGSREAVATLADSDAVVPDALARRLRDLSADSATTARSE